MEASLVVMLQGEKEWGRQHGLCLRMVAAINTGAGTDQRREGRGAYSVPCGENSCVDTLWSSADLKGAELTKGYILCSS